MSNATLKTGAELRRAYLDFFIQHGHTEVPSSPLVPHGDPTLMFTTAGMVQFKPYYTSTGDVPYTRATSVQKCLRLTDLDNVGLTPRHDTFFEMLGNFSFGPKAKGAYFKDEATALAWEFVTKTLGLPKERLFISIFGGEPGVPRDDEAAELWKKLGLPADHLVALGRKDNFWGPAGGAGACGPCSEIYFDLGEKRPDYLPEGAFWGEAPGDPGDRYMEFWNLVFPQFDAAPDGTLNLLPNPGIDTGMGIERLSLILQGRNTIFETDLFAPMVDAVLTHSRGGGDRRSMVRDARIIADHVRALTFAISEGALPGNEGAGYVLRRLLRRAVTRGRSRQGLALHEAFLPRVADQVVAQFGGHYKDLTVHRDRILRVLEQEEAGFGQTYEAGMTRLEEYLGGGAWIAQQIAQTGDAQALALAEQGGLLSQEPPKIVPGGFAFELHDTFGFPIELTEEIAAERGILVDRSGFEQAMGAQRERARATSKFGKARADQAKREWVVVAPQGEIRTIYDPHGALTRLGVRLLAWVEVERGSTYDVILDHCVFYSESGGQVSDSGGVTGGPSIAEVESVVHVAEEAQSNSSFKDVRIVRIRVAQGTWSQFLEAGVAGQLVTQVAPKSRSASNRHHTATHLLHAALRHVLGTHVHQAGSLVAPDRLRFDYSHYESPSPEQLAAIEARVNEWVLANRAVSSSVMAIEDAKKLGAMALFGEKYGAEVRVVRAEGVAESDIEPSLELCGGTHVSRTGDIGAFVITSESAIASGVRRLEALCGPEALGWLKGHQVLLTQAAHALQSPPATVPAQIEKLKAETTSLRAAQMKLELDGMKRQVFADLEAEPTFTQGPCFVVKQYPVRLEPKLAREIAIEVKSRMRDGLAVFRFGETAIATATGSTMSRFGADSAIGEIMKHSGGRGGGKKDLAQGGAADAEKLTEAFKRFAVDHEGAPRIWVSGPDEPNVPNC